ncbi:fumarylacetoacetate hydrolase domain-containing protein 2A [Penicillium crustosum]|uniref:fumarylacetoacetate hydrolase domain-containing protein 2A n=1 Tax=Penicillium crustosum TaxID=36656 RepID=UPI0023A47679|nr:fumarylacetoacetate hydrolase domain-containing protein 2A [Penicillium crustosum]KAJ5409937.1 fumarylacetoacetate hydrolase domain-containing protein 2A [Penicillium crustosum]
MSSLQTPSGMFYTSWSAYCRDPCAIYQASNCIALTSPSPAMINISKLAQDGFSDCEAELSFVISKSGHDIPE